MSRLKLRLESLQKSLLQLAKRIDKIKQLQLTKHLQDELWDAQESVIKCFEISYELLWKALKDYLEAEHGLLVASPKKVFHECQVVVFIDDRETELLLAMIDARNSTVHEYNPDMAEDITENIIHEFYPLIKIITERFINHKNAV
jgi:nucleotidyltransferase substrate binding protein (TIGR01987 family)